MCWRAIKQKSKNYFKQLYISFNARDWCISRQLWWGHRIPAYRVTLKSQVSFSSLWVKVWCRHRIDVFKNQWVYKIFLITCKGKNLCIEGFMQKKKKCSNIFWWHLLCKELKILKLAKKLPFSSDMNASHNLKQKCFCIWATSWENRLMPYANNKDADQLAHLRSLISAFLVRCLDRIIPILAIAKILVL